MCSSIHKQTTRYFPLGIVLLSPKHPSRSLKLAQKSFQLIEQFQSLAARFGPSLPPTGLRVLAVGGEPADGCMPMEEAPKANFTFRGVTPKFVAVIVRGQCSFAGI